MYIVISMPKRRSMAEGVSHFIDNLLQVNETSMVAWKPAERIRSIMK
jgi:hypothetical protein